VSHFSLQQNRK